MRITASLPHWSRPVLAAASLFWIVASASGDSDQPAQTDPENPPRVASRVTSEATAPRTSMGDNAPSHSDSIAQAMQAIADYLSPHYSKIRDYTCTFHKRERIDGRLSHAHVMDMKARTSPSSIYFKFRSPNKGREAIYVVGRNNGKVLAHDVGIGKFLAGTLSLDPRGSMAMEDCRHPITEAGIPARRRSRPSTSTGVSS